MEENINKKKIGIQIEHLEKLNFKQDRSFCVGEGVSVSNVILKHEALGVEAHITIPECEEDGSIGRVMFLNMDAQHHFDMSRVEELAFFANYKF